MHEDGRLFLKGDDVEIIPDTNGCVTLKGPEGIDVLLNFESLKEQLFSGKLTSDVIKIINRKHLTQNNNNSNSKTMPNEEKTETSIDQAQVEKIKGLSCKKHVKIYKLHKLGMSNKDIATALGTNSGACHNALKDYAANAEKVKKADEITVE